FGRLQRVLPLIAAIVTSSLGFMAHHVVVLSVYFPGQFLTAVMPFSLGVAVGGAVWAWLYHHTNSLAATWLSHVLVDAAIMAVGYDLLCVRGWRAAGFRPAVWTAGTSPTARYSRRWSSSSCKRNSPASFSRRSSKRGLGRARPAFSSSDCPITSSS